MGMDNRFLRPFEKALAALLSYLFVTIGNDFLTTQGGDQLRTIQDA